MKITEMLRNFKPTRDGRREMSMGRRTTHDVSFTFRMLAGSPGDVTRKHPCQIEPALNDITLGSTFFGQAVIVYPTNSSVRVPAAGDSALTKVYGITVRPFPFQPSSASNYGALAIGATVAPVLGAPIDVLKEGYCIVTLQGAAAAKKGTAVNVCIVAGTGYVVGGFSADTVSGTFITLSDAFFNGAADASGNVEIIFRNT